MLNAHNECPKNIVAIVLSHCSTNVAYIRRSNKSVPLLSVRLPKQLKTIYLPFISHMIKRICTKTMCPLELVFGERKHGKNAATTFPIIIIIIIMVELSDTSETRTLCSGKENEKKKTVGGQ